MSIRLLIADHHVAAVAGVRHFLAGTEIEVVAEAGDGNRAVALTLDVGPDVALMAVRLPEEDGLVALDRIKHARPDVPVLMTACDYHPAELAQAYRLGASGLLLKDFSRQDLVDAIERVAAGGQMWSREEIRRVAGVVASDQRAAAGGVPLTRREGDVLRCLTRGLTNRQIAGELGISCETVKEHVQHLIRKIGVKDRTQAAVWAVRNRLD